MLKKINNLHLLFLVGIISLLSVVLIQRYVMAQNAWVDPNSLPGVTPGNTFVLNPLTDDIDLNGNALLSTNIDIDSAGPKVIDVKGSNTICLSGSGSQDCRSEWPTLEGSILGSAGFLSQFTGTGTLVDSKIEEVSLSRYKLDNGAFWVRNQGGGYNALQLDFANTNVAYNALLINNSSDGDGGAIRIIDTDPANGGTSTANRNSLYIRNGTNGNSLYINDTGNNYDGSPVVIDSNGKMGIGTSTPNPTTASDGVLHIQTNYNNAELDIESGWAGKHWGIYQNIDDGALRFWNYDDRLAIDSSGNVGIGTNLPDYKLEVVGTGRFDGLLTETLSANTITANRGFLSELISSTLTAEDGLVINTPNLTMEADNGDSCTITLRSSRVNPTTEGAGWLDIKCYAPTNVCGNSIVEPSNGEECDPVGSVRYSYSISEPGLYDCSAYSTFNRARISCEASCLENSAICQCRFRCISETPPHEEYYVIDACGTPGPTACAGGWGP